MIHVAVMGYGTIGSGVVEILEKNRETITKRTGDTVNVKYVLDLREFPGTPVENKIVHDFSVIENDPEVTMVIETMGGLNPAYPFVKACLEAGKHVATSNKALVAAHGTELLRLPERKMSTSSSKPAWAAVFRLSVRCTPLLRGRRSRRLPVF